MGEQWMRGPSQASVDGDGDALMRWYDDLLDNHWAGTSSRKNSLEKEAQAQFPTNQTLGWADWLFQEKRPHLIASEDGLMLNTGIMLIRASVWSWQFFQKVRWMTFGKSPVTQHPWWEQTAMVYLLQLPFTLWRASLQKPGALEDIGPTPGLHRGFAPACVLLSQKQL